VWVSTGVQNLLDVEVLGGGGVGRVVVADLLDDWHGVPLLLASFILSDWTGAVAVHSVGSRTRLVVDLGPTVQKLTAMSLPVVGFLVC